MDIAEIGQIVLRLAHGLAAAVWVGGGAYYVLALRPGLRQQRNDEGSAEFVRAVQREFGEWASVATLVMIATGVVLMFERLTGGQGTTVYVALLGVKIAAAVAAFWITGVFRRGTRGRSGRRTGRLDRAWMALALSIAAFLLGALLTTVYPALGSG